MGNITKRVLSEAEKDSATLVKDMGHDGGVYAAQGKNGKWYLGRFYLQEGQISNGRQSCAGHSVFAVIDAGYAKPYATLEEARKAAK